MKKYKQIFTPLIETRTGQFSLINRLGSRVYDYFNSNLRNDLYAVRLQTRNQDTILKWIQHSGGGENLFYEEV